MKKDGFTLVELLVVMAILSVAGVVILTIFTRTLRGSNKSQIIGVIKQNGQAVLEVIDKNVRGADGVVCPVVEPPDTSASSPNIVVVKEGVYTRFRFVDDAIKLDYPVKEDDATTGKEETDAQLRNRICDMNNPLQDEVVLTDTNPKSGVVVADGQFSRDRSPGFGDTVSIYFKVGPGAEAPQAVAGQIDPVEFQTTVQLR